jgi:polyisoprenoid-binding protein YceI
MKNLILPLIAGFILLTSAMISITSENKIAENYKISFESKDPSGTFDKMEGTIIFDEGNLSAASFDLSFPISSLNTANKMRDKKAQTSDWFDTAKFPNATFKSSDIVKTDKGFNISGTMTMKGISKTIMVPMLAKISENGTILYGGFGVNRIDFKIGKPNGAVPDVMNVKFYIPILK